jgi:hypothetical protein
MRNPRLIIAVVAMLLGACASPAALEEACARTAFEVPFPTKHLDANYSTVRMDTVLVVDGWCEVGVRNCICLD